MNNWSGADQRQRLDLIKRHWTLGASAMDLAMGISKTTGEHITRNSIVGYYTRYSLHLSSYPLGGRGGGDNRSKVKANERAERKEFREKSRSKGRQYLRTAMPRRQTPPNPDEVLHEEHWRRLRERIARIDAGREGLTKSLLELRSNECRWVVSTEPHMFCAAECEGSYCGDHRTIVYLPPRQRLTKR